MDVSKILTEEYDFNNSQKSTEESLFNEDIDKNGEEILDNENDKDKQIEQLIKVEARRDKDKEVNTSLHEKIESKINIKSFEKNNENYCPLKEKYNYDPYLESNIINRFFFYWPYNIIKLAKNYELKISDLGRPSKSNNSKYFLNDFKRIWEDLGYKNYKN